MIGTTAPEWFVTTIPEEAYEGGLMSRYLVCYLAERDTFHLDIEEVSDCTGVLSKLALELRGCVEALPKGQIRGGPGTRDWLAQFYGVNEHERVVDPRMEAHRNRRPANLLRLALLFTCAGADERLEVRHLEAARGVLRYIEPTILEMYASTDVWTHEVGKAELRVMAKMAGEGGEMGHVELVQFASRHVRGGMRDVKFLLEGLTEKEMIMPVVRAFGNSNVWPPSRWRVRGGK